MRTVLIAYAGTVRRAHRGVLICAAILTGSVLMPALGTAFSIGGSQTCLGPVCPPFSQVIGHAIHEKITEEALAPIQYSSPTGLISFTPGALNEIEIANAAVDGLQQNPEFHFDACSNNPSNNNECFERSSRRLINGKAFLLQQLSQPATISAAQAHQLRVLFGNYLHMLQDFYAHTNFVNAFPGLVANLGTSLVPNQVPGTNPCLPGPGALVYPSVQYLTSGWANSTPTAFPPLYNIPAPFLTAPLGQCAHGAPSIFIAFGAAPGGMHKDDPSRPFFSQAYSAAVADTANFARDILLAANNADSVCMFMTDKPCSEPKLVAFGLGADDFGSLSIGGDAICTYDNISAAGGCTGSFKMVPGVWYDISIIYKNRAGSNGMSLTWDQPQGVPTNGYGFAGGFPLLVPKANFRTLSQSSYVSGLRGDYYTLGGILQSTVVGEGPIDAINTVYNSQVVGSWNGYGYFSQFEERLTGQIRISP